MNIDFSYIFNGLSDKAKLDYVKNLVFNMLCCFCDVPSRPPKLLKALRD